MFLIAGRVNNEDGGLHGAIIALIVIVVLMLIVVGVFVVVGVCYLDLDKFEHFYLNVYCWIVFS